MMNLENVRSSFVVYNLDSSESRLSYLNDSLARNEFQVYNFLKPKELLSEIKSNPPHILFINIESILKLRGDFVKKIKEISPESRTIITSSKANFTKAYKLFDTGVFDFIFSDYFSIQASVDKSEINIAIANVLKTADHAVEMDYFKYKNEQLSADAQGSESKKSMSIFLIHNLWLKRLERCENFTKSIDCFMEEICRVVKKSEVIYLKYVPAYKTLVSSRARNINEFTVGATFDLSKLFESETIDETNLENNVNCRRLFTEYTKWDSYSVVPLRVDGELRGVFLLHMEKLHEVNSYILACINSLALKISNIVLEKKMHSINHKDEVTGLYNRKYLMGRLKDEVCRARRIFLPISFILISFDKFGTIIEDLSDSETDATLRLIAKLLDQTSRINDIVGRISSDEYGIILPHTPFHGALIKAERIRSLVAQTDFSLISPKIKDITVSLGVSEYPSHCRDVEDMLEMADKAMVEVSRAGGDQVCVSSVPSSFKPEFSYK